MTIRNSILFTVIIIVICSCNEGKQYVNKDVVENYQNKQAQIAALAKYFNSITPLGKFVEIEFDGDDHLFRFGIYSIDSTTKELILPGFLAWDLNTESDSVRFQIKNIGWTNETLKSIKQKLEEANCISVESGNPCKIGFQRRALGKYFYNVFLEPMAFKLENLYKTNCAYLFYSKQVVFEWGNGAIGSGCYPTN